MAMSSVNQQYDISWDDKKVENVPKLLANMQKNFISFNIMYT